MSSKLNDTQLVLLSAASQREDHYLTPPAGARLGPARKAATKLLEAGLVKEVRARKDAPVWRRDEDADQAFAFKLTAAGLKAIVAEANEDSGEAALMGGKAPPRMADHRSPCPERPTRSQLPKQALSRRSQSLRGPEPRSATSS